MLRAFTNCWIRAGKKWEKIRVMSTICIPTNKGRSTFISAVNKRKDTVYRKLVDEYTTVENAPFGNAKYHKSCYKAFTSKQNLSTCSNFKSTRPTSASCNQNPSSSEDNFTIVTRSRASEIHWTAWIFCKHKAFKHDRKMHKVSWENRTQSIKRVAEQTLYFRNLEVVKKIAGDQVTDCVDLFSIQEETDTIIILHALHADE